MLLYTLQMLVRYHTLYYHHVTHREWKLPELCEQYLFTLCMIMLVLFHDIDSVSLYPYCHCEVSLHLEAVDQYSIMMLCRLHVEHALWHNG